MNNSAVSHSDYVQVSLQDLAASMSRDELYTCIPGVLIIRTPPKHSQFAALRQSVEELSQNMQTFLQTAQEMLQNIQAFLKTPRTNVTVKDAGNAAAPHANVAASKRRDGGLGSARRSGRGVYAAVDEGGQETVAEAPRETNAACRIGIRTWITGSAHHTHFIAQTGANK